MKQKKQFIEAKTLEGFQTALSSGKVSENQIGFIEKEDLIWAKGKYYGAIPNEEDINKDSEGKLQLADREYNPENFSGLAYVYLRKNVQDGKNVLTQDMLNKPNTIYEIRYAYDLNGAEINVPEGCVLKFNGGSLSNGTLNGNNYEIEAGNIKIFSQIKFIGLSANNIKYQLDWFVGTYTDGIYNSIDIDSSVEINEALNSGIKYIIFPNNKFYYLKKPIIVNGDVQLLSNNKERQYDTLSRTEIGHNPCIYSNEIITLLDYKYKSSDNRYSLTIGSINFYCRKTYTDLLDKNIPIVSIKTNGTSIWGLTFSANINSLDYEIRDEDKNIHIPNYTGLLLQSENGNITYVKINGYIQMTYYGIITKNFENSGGGWFTDLTINGDTRCVIGGIFNGGKPIRIFGSHQPIKVPTKYVEDIAYFSGSWINIYGFIWDVNSSSDGTKTVEFPIEIDSYNGFFNSELGFLGVKRHGLHYVRNYNDSWLKPESENWLNVLLSVNSQRPFADFSYTLGGVDIFDASNIILYNSFNLFNSNQLPLYNHQNSAQITSSNNCFIKALDDIDAELKIMFTIIGSQLGYKEKQRLRFMMNAASESKVTIKLVNLNGEEEVLTETTMSSNDLFYPASLFGTDYIKEGKITDNINVQVTFTQKIKISNGSVYNLPVMYVPAARAINVVYGGDTNHRPKLHNNIKTLSIKYYDTTLQQFISYINGKWYVDDNIPVGSLSSGTFAQKPLASTGIKVGFQYLATDVRNANAIKGMVIYHKGNDKWIAPDGTPVTSVTSLAKDAILFNSVIDDVIFGASTAGNGTPENVYYSSHLKCFVMKVGSSYYNNFDNVTLWNDKTDEFTPKPYDNKYYISSDNNRYIWNNTDLVINEE